MGNAKPVVDKFVKKNYVPIIFLPSVIGRGMFELGLSEHIWTISTLRQGIKCLERQYKAPGTYEPPHDKTNRMSVHPAKTQISLGIHPV